MLTDPYLSFPTGIKILRKQFTIKYTGISKKMLNISTFIKNHISFDVIEKMTEKILVECQVIKKSIFYLPEKGFNTLDVYILI